MGEDQIAREPYPPFPAKSIKTLFKALYVLSRGTHFDDTGLAKKGWCGIKMMV
ncbi:MAG: hypothetical protein KAS98_04115 [Deltaproteobacteria bacterium]|nr:hypothetical protein [Deltaproteobacteria bacterium]